MSRSAWLASVVSGAALLVSCVTGAPPDSSAAPAPDGAARATPTVKELDGARLCRTVFEVKDAAARAGLGPLRARYEATSSTDRHALFGALLAQSKNEDRFRSFHEDAAAHADSAVGPLGECLVYADWKMARESEAPCARARALLASDAAALAVVTVAEVDLLARSGDVDGAVKAADAALAKAPKCEALHLARAQAIASRGDVAASKAAWTAAQEVLPGCFVCSSEKARLVEASEGRAAAAAEYERALQVAPDHADTLRRFAAAVAGVDDVRALAAYDAAVEAGARDFQTLMAAARLAARLLPGAGGSPQQVDKALGYARRAADAQKTDPDARRLVVELAMKKGDDAAAVQAAQQLLNLVPDDVAGHVALARSALKREQLEDAVVHYDLAWTELAAGRTAGLDEGTVTAVRAERAGLLKTLMVDEASPPTGNAATVANVAQRGLQKLWKDRLKKKVVSVGGPLTVVVETDASGAVVDVAVKDEGAKDPMVRAAAVAWLRRATITGGAKRYTLELSLQ